MSTARGSARILFLLVALGGCGDDPVGAAQQQALALVQSPAAAHLDRLDQRALPLDGQFEYANTAPDVTFYVLSTGIHISHDEFGGRARYGFSAFSSDPADAEDCQGVGTAIASLVAGSTYGVAKGAQLVAVRVLGQPLPNGFCTNSGTAATVLAGLQYVQTATLDDDGPAVVVMGLASGTPIPGAEAIILELFERGIVVVVAAGNSSADACNFFPAQVGAAITVGSTTTDTDARLAISNFGPCVDLFAPGSDLLAATLRDANGNASNSATSLRQATAVSTALVAGIAGLYLQSDPTASAQTVTDALLDGATPGVVGDVGTGSPNRLSYSSIALRATPVLVWTAPADIVAGTRLGSAQLSATADVDGTFAYTPPAGTLLAAGNAQPLSVLFTPAASINYVTASASVSIDVLTPPEAVRRLEAAVRALGIGRISTAFLLATLLVAERALEQRLTGLARLALSLFKVEVGRLLDRGAMTASQADPLIRDAAAILAVL